MRTTWFTGTLLALTLAHSALAQSPGDPVAARLNGELAPYLASLAAHDSFSGVFLVARDGKPIYRAAFGKANEATGEAITADTRFNLGSMNKMFTAVGIAQLVQSGRISLDGTVGTYLQDYPDRDVAEHVTIRQLLTHTSGLGDYFQRGYPENGVRIARATDLLKYFTGDSLAFRPGARMGYSNAGFALLGAIIERVSGRSYFEYIQQNIFDKAGMRGAGFDNSAPHTAVGYTRDIAGGHEPGPGTGPRHANGSQVEARGGPAGGAFATAQDMVQFSRALWSGRLVSRELVDTFTTGKVAMGPVVKYAFGFGETRNESGHTVGHNGGAPGANAEFAMYPETGVDVVVLSNFDPPTAGRVIARIRKLLAQ